MPRKTEKPAVQKGGTVVASPDVAASEQETPPRRSARTAARGDGSSVANRSRRSSTAAQTAASVAESRVTRSSRSNSSRRSSSPQENVRTRSSRETSAESPASRVKATRRSTSRINYQESEGEEDTSVTTERNEEEYLVEEDAEESDSEESNRSRNKTKTPPKSPPKIRGRGRGRITKTVGRGRGKIAQFEEPSDKENDKISGTDTTDSMAAPRTRRQQKEVEPVAESGRRTRGSGGQKEQIEAVPVRASRRNEKKVKVDAEGESVPLSKPKPAKSTRGRQSYTEEEESPAHEEEEHVTEQKEVGETPGEEQEEEKRKRKLKTTEEPHKRQKLEQSTVESGNIMKPDEPCTKVESMEENSNSEKPVETNVTKVEPIEDDLSSKASSTPNAKKELVPEQSVITQSVTKEETTVDSEQEDRDTKEEDEPMEVQPVDDLSFQKVSEDHTVAPIDIQEEKMECEEEEEDGKEEEGADDSDERNISHDDQKTQEIDASEKTDADSRVSTEEVETVTDEQKQETDLSSSKNNEEEEKGEDVSTDDEVKSVIKEHKVAFVNPETTEPITTLPVERTTGDQTAPTNLTSEIANIGDSNTYENEDDTLKEQKSEVYTTPHWEKELSTASVLLPSSESSFQCPSTQSAELSSVQDDDPKPLGHSETASFRENNIAHSAHVLVSESNRAAVESNNAIGVGSNDALSVNGADMCVEKSAENALDMSKGSDDSASETERITSDLSLHPATTTVLECATTKANGTHHNISSTEPPPFALTNRKYIINPSLNEDTKSRLKSTTFSLISFNMGAMRNETAYTEKLGLEIRRTEADIICLQEIKMTFYSEALEQVMNNFGYRGLLSIPENRSRGLGIFYNTKTFNLIRQAGIPLQKVIDQDLETSSLENNDKAAVRDFLEKCGHMLVAQLKSVIADRTLTIANVLFPPCDIGTHALQMSSSVREVVSFLDDIACPHVICGSFNMTEGSVAYQLLREGYLNNEMIEELQQRKDVRLPGKENDTLVNLLWKAFQHPSSNLRSCYATAMGHELRLGHEKSITSPDLLWYSSDSLETLGVLDVGPAGENLDHVALKADIAYAC